ncbi:MAG: tRNA (adenosine(37)-N6)-threonylcarbamoyltransferase complex dimerization subunit type 1 TsaB [Antricoccus sp.]
MSERTTLFVDTSTSRITVAIVRAGVLTERVVTGATAHGESLTPLIEQVVGEAIVNFAEIQRIVVGLGPGPFTGLRVGIVTAEAIGQSLGIPVTGFCSLDAIKRPQTQDLVLVVSDARRKEVYWALFDQLGRRVDGPGVAKPADLVAQLAARDSGPGSTISIVSAGAEKYLAEFSQLGSFSEGWPSASWLLTHDITTPGPLIPLYLRRPDAVPPTSAVAR